MFNYDQVNSSENSLFHPIKFKCDDRSKSKKKNIFYSFRRFCNWKLDPSQIIPRKQFLRCELSLNCLWYKVQKSTDMDTLWGDLRIDESKYYNFIFDNST
jgi:hypothetical protein